MWNPRCPTFRFPQILIQQDSEFDKLHGVRRRAKIKDTEWQDSEILVLFNLFIINQIFFPLDFKTYTVYF